MKKSKFTEGQIKEYSCSGQDSHESKSSVSYMRRRCSEAKV